MDSKNPEARSNLDAPSTSSKRPSSEGPESRCLFENLVVLNFKATMSEYYYDHPYEIIRMAATVLYGPGPDWTVKPETDFSEIVRPSKHPKLTRYVKQLTGTTQEDIDEAEEFPKVFEKFEQWLETTGVAKSNFTIVTEPRSNIWKLAQYQFILSNMSLPVYLKRFISVPEIYYVHKSIQAAKQKEEVEPLEEVQGVKQAQALENPDVNNSALYDFNQDLSSETLSEECEPIPRNPNDLGHLVFGREVARMREWGEPGVDSPPNSQESAESNEFDQLDEELDVLNDVDPVEQPRPVKRASDESINSEEFSGFDNVPSKKIKLTEHSFMENMCNYYNIQRTGKRHNAADDAVTLRDIVKEMLKSEKFFFRYTCMLVCFDEKREFEWHQKLLPDWRQDLSTTGRVFEKVLPLFCRLLDIEKHVDYAKCITCEKPLEVCGADWTHQQFPSELFDPSKKICGEILFATEAGLDINKSLQGDSDAVKNAGDQNGEKSDGGDEYSDEGEKNL